MFSDANGRIAAERVEFDLSAGTGVFHDASGIMAMGQFANPSQFAGQDPDVYFYGERIEMLPNRKYRITKGAFTTCVQPTPRWELTSGSVDITLDDYAIAKGTVLRVKGVPVFYLPVMYYPLQDEERATGFLLPTYGTSTYRGQAVSNGFFWAMGRSRDLTLMHDWFTRSGQGAGAEYRYVADASSSGNVKVYRFTRKTTSYETDGVTTVLPGEQGVEVQATVNHRLTPRLRARARVDYFSDLLNQQLYHQNIYQSTRSTAGDRRQRQRHVRPRLRQRAVPAQRVPDEQRQVERLRQHAAADGEHRAADALRLAGLRVGLYRVRLHPRSATAQRQRRQATGRSPSGTCRRRCACRCRGSRISRPTPARCTGPPTIPAASTRTAS